jgi:hypothetical protein
MLDNPPEKEWRKGDTESISCVTPGGAQSIEVGGRSVKFRAFDLGFPNAPGEALVSELTMGIEPDSRGIGCNEEPRYGAPACSP